MKSGKQKKRELKLQRERKQAKKAALLKVEHRKLHPMSTVPVNMSALAPNNSYGTSFSMRGYYIDIPFVCKDCEKEELWTATQQKWWYEVAKGDVNTIAVRCRACRKKEQIRKAEARIIQKEGMERKKALKGKKGI